MSDTIDNETWDRHVRALSEMASSEAKDSKQYRAADEKLQEALKLYDDCERLHKRTGRNLLWMAGCLVASLICLIWAMSIHWWPAS